MEQKKHIEHKTKGSRRSSRDYASTVLAVVMGLGVGWLDLHVTEVVLTIVALTASGMLLGIIQPVAAWRWALLVAIGLPVMELVAIKFHLQTAEPVQLNLLITMAALVFALLGAYAGVFFRYLLRT